MEPTVVMAVIESESVEASFFALLQKVDNPPLPAIFLKPLPTNVRQVVVYKSEIRTLRLHTRTAREAVSLIDPLLKPASYSQSTVGQAIMGQSGTL